MQENYKCITSNSKLNKVINFCFQYINESDQRKFIKKFRSSPLADPQTNHTLHELLLGAYLSASGFIVEYERKIQEKKPDWSILDASSKIIAIVENVTHHLPKEIENNINNQHKAGKLVIGYKPDEIDPDHQRLKLKNQTKVNTYMKIVTDFDVPYILAIFGHYYTALGFEDVANCLMGGKASLFRQYPDLSGVLYYCEDTRSYKFW
ncbi:MAG: hypothetical protein IBX69_16820, partial [Anaerolineales bacterium]|nr:hypothetical protein [Anaerolineales bacterium]